MFRQLKFKKVYLLTTAIFLAVFILSGCTSLEDKYDEGYDDGYDDATATIDYRSESYSAGYDEGYTNCQNGIGRQY